MIPALTTGPFLPAQETADSDISAEELLDRALEALDAGDYDRALAWVDLALQKVPESPELIRYRESVIRLRDLERGDWGNAGESVPPGESPDFRIQRDEQEEEALTESGRERDYLSLGFVGIRSLEDRGLMVPAWGGGVPFLAGLDLDLRFYFPGTGNNMGLFIRYGGFVDMSMN